MHRLIFQLLIFFFTVVATAQTNPPVHTPPYPAHWWAEISSEGAPSWEILPQSAYYGEVIVSKRNELGILSNFAPTPFEYRGKKYASIEGFWQSLKFPENSEDPRAQFAGLNWPHTRQQVEQMTAFAAKDAGNIGSENMKKMGIDWVSFEGKHLVYKERGESPFYFLILDVMKAKLNQNPEVKKILLQTDKLILKPDHHDNEAKHLKAWQYYEIWMKLRKESRER